MAADRRPSPSSARGAKDNSYTLAVMSIIVVLLAAFASLQYYLPYASTCSSYRAYNSTLLSHTTTGPNGEKVLRIAVITDLDHDSKHPTKKNTWQSLLKKGELTIDKDLKKAHIRWDDHDVYVSSQIAAGGRSMELSDLAVFDGQLLTVDDRTGIAYRIHDLKDMIPYV